MSKVEKTVERSIYGQDYNYYFALTNSLYCTFGEAKMRLSADYFFGNQNMADAHRYKTWFFLNNVSIVHGVIIDFLAFKMKLTIK